MKLRQAADLLYEEAEHVKRLAADFNGAPEGRASREFGYLSLRLRAAALLALSDVVLREDE